MFICMSNYQNYMFCKGILVNAWSYKRVLVKIIREKIYCTKTVCPAHVFRHKSRAIQG